MSIIRGAWISCGQKYSSSEFTGVSFQSCKIQGRPVKRPWKGVIEIGGKRIGKSFKAERQAAIWYDTERIKAGLEPVNILKRKAA